MMNGCHRVMCFESGPAAYHTNCCHSQSGYNRRQAAEAAIMVFISF